SRKEVEGAYNQASEWYEERKHQWRRKFAEAVAGSADISVVLLGRPYTVLSERMNAGIPEILARHGVRAYFQDMLEPVQNGDPGFEALCRQTKWRNARRIFEAAWQVCNTPGVYPILLTSFKCTPDACTMEHFRRIMDSFGKPYLILQLDEHDSRVGYETRVEAALRTFRNHHAGDSDGRGRLERLPRPLPARGDPTRTVFVPHWDTLATPLFVAGLQEVGVDARLLRETPGLIRTSLGDNTGQCLPLSIILHEFVEQVKRERLDPARCSLWMPNSSIACNICFFLQYGRTMLERIGGGFERAGLYPGEITCHEISPKATLNAFYAFYFGGMLRRMQCRTRPYEKNPGQTDEVVEWGLELLKQAMLGAVPKQKAVRKVVDAFLQIDREGEQRPIVAIFGDLYARDNDVFNQDLIRLVEAHGGEALTTPYSEYVKVIAKPYLRKWIREGNYKDVLLSAPFAYSMDLLEYPFRREFERVLGRRKVVKRMGRPEELLGRFGVSMYHTGESFDNLLKIFHLLERYPEIALFVQTSPAFCCPSLVTEAMASKIEQQTGRPVVTVNYDGTSADHNRIVIPYLELAVRRAQG
ncbi:MAG: CoA activase, partial [Deltaproteobacteria bacterium]